MIHLIVDKRTLKIEISERVKVKLGESK